MTGGFWKAPRVLTRWRTSRQLTANEFSLLMFVAMSGADRPGGFATTNPYLAEALDVSVRTIERALRGLRAKGLIAFEEHQGKATFVVRTTPALATLEHASAPPPTAGSHCRKSLSEVTGGGSSDTAEVDTAAMPHQERDREASDFRHLRSPKTETEKEKKTFAAPNAGAANNATTNTRQPRRRDLLFEAVCAVCDIDPASLTRSGRGPLNRAVRELREAGATEAEVYRRRDAYRARFNGAPLTASALAKHWASLGPPRSTEPAEDEVARMERRLDQKKERRR